jgi:hypothetical protein
MKILKNTFYQKMKHFNYSQGTGLSIIIVKNA